MLIQGDAALIPFLDKTFHCVVTSPPYWGLRKYLGAQGRGMFPNLGLEPTPELHIEHMVKIFREIRRVLRDDGVVYLNYGDCYAGSGGENANIGLGSGDRSGLYRNNPRRTKIAQGNLMMMPHKVAIALQNDGWIVRNDLIWFKRNPMPESVAGWRWERSRKEKNRIVGGSKQASDYAGSWEGPLSGGEDKVEWEYGDDHVLRKGSWRHTRAHEFIFQLTKKMNYYSNQEAVREAASYPFDDRGARADVRRGTEMNSMSGKTGSGRNPRSVLDVPTAPYKGAHYATFPPNLIAPLIRASCPKRCCPECGAPWAPVVEKQVSVSTECPKTQSSHEARGGTGKPTGTIGKSGSGRTDGYSSVTDYRPTCSCEREDHIPGIVLDPFIGSGTTGAVARELGSRWVGLDISYEYLDQQAKIRALNWTPSNALDNLPLFADFSDE